MNKKIVVFSLNVGSAIQYRGDKIFEWCKEISSECVLYPYQTSTPHTIDFLKKEKPDLIITNSFFPRIFETVFYYKMYNPDIKLIHIEECPDKHIYEINKTLKSIRDSRSNSKTISQIHSLYTNLKHFYSVMVDKVFISKPTMEDDICKNKNKEKFKHFEHKLNYANFNNDVNLFRIKRNWKERRNNFLFLGTIINNKLSLTFLDLLRSTDLKIDVYGNLCDDENYNEIITKHKNLNVFPPVEFEKVPEVFNQYKYFVMARAHTEPTCNSMFQSIMCGTIPFIANDRTQTKWDATWLDIVKGFVYECNKDEELISNMQEALKLENDNKYTDGMGDVSKTISDTMREKLDSNKTKESFLYEVKRLLK